MARRRQLISLGMPSALAEYVVGKPQSLVLAGSSATDAAKIVEAKVLFTTASAGGAILPQSDPGDEYELKNESGNTATIYPPTGATINGTTSFSMATAKSAKVWFSTPTACHTNPTVAS